jgi:CRP/FNR family transcriptional regulator, cyclic AMP receptor protein
VTKPTSITVFADSSVFLILYLGFRNIVAIATCAQSAKSEGIQMSTNCTTLTNRAHGFPVGLSFAAPSAVKHNLKIVTKKMDASHNQGTAFAPQILLTRIVAGKSPREYPTDDSIFSQGDPADAVFYIQTGKVKLTVVSASGKEAVIACLPEKSFFGEGSLAGQPLRMSTASALQPSAIVRIEKTVMLGLLQREPGFSEQFLAHMLSRNMRMEADLVDHLFNSSEKRLARLLLLLANFGQDSKPVPVIAKMSQETLAEMIGTTRSRVSFFLNRFRELGFINYNGSGMQIHSSLGSVVLNN